MSTEQQYIPDDLTFEQREERFHEIYNKYHMKIFNYIAKCIGDREDANDLLQDVFLLFYDRLPRLDITTGRIEAWLLRVARNLSMTHSRNRSKRMTSNIEFNEPADRSDSDRNLQKKELQLKLDEFLTSLTERERTIFILHKLEGVKYKDLMKIFDISHRTLKRIVRSVLNKLKDRDIFNDNDFINQ